MRPQHSTDVLVEIWMGAMSKPDPGIFALLANNMMGKGEAFP